jgi:hypothetical protein
MLHHFFSCRDVYHRTKDNIYTVFPLNALPWGYETWTLTTNNLKKLEAFHHGAARRIRNIKWSHVREEKIRNTQIGFRLCDTSNIKAFIIRRTARYIGKVAKASEDAYPKKTLVTG